MLRGRGIASIVSSPLSRARDTAEAVAAVLGLPVAMIDDLKEVAFGVHEGTAMGGQWFSDWVDRGITPEGGESFADLRTRAVGAVTQALTRPPPVLVVAHGALFRALRAEMGLSADVRTANAMPLFCEPGQPWDADAGDLNGRHRVSVRGTMSILPDHARR